MQKADFTLFFSMPLDEVDWDNLARSKVVRVMLPLGLADTGTLDRLWSMGVGVVLRIEEGTYYDQHSPEQIAQRVVDCALHAHVHFAIIGCEPEAHYDWRWGYDWHQDQAWPHRSAVARTSAAIHNRGYRTASPGWRMRMISETDPPEPGWATWLEICRIEYDSCDLNGCHLYEYGWESWVDENRFRTTLQRFMTDYHKDLVIDEIGVGSGDQVAKMSAYINIAQIILDDDYILGDRVKMLCPFVSNGAPGNPPVYDPEYIIRDPAAYDLLGTWMSTGT